MLLIVERVTTRVNCQGVLNALAMKTMDFAGIEMPVRIELSPG